MRTLPALRVAAAGETGATRGARDGGAETGLDGGSNFGATVGGAMRAVGALGATSASGRCGRAGAGRFGERSARSLGSACENPWRENGSRRDGGIRGRDFTVWRGCEFGETRGARGFTGAANEGCERSKGKW